MYKVFIVDDEPFIIEGLYDIVDWAQLGLEIVGQAENGLDALNALKVIPTDILVTDISMPMMNGLDLIRAVREFQPDLKVIILSGYDEFGYLKEGMTLGIENYLLKPINLEEFKATLNMVVEKLNVSRVKYTLNEHSMMILKDNVMHRWLRNQIKPQEFQERVDLLGLVVNKPFVLVSLFRPEHSNAQVFESVMNHLGSRPGIIPFRDMDGDIVLLYNFDDPELGKDEADKTSHELMSILSPYQTLHLSLGSVEDMEAGAPRSYNNAKKAQEYFMIFPEQNILRYDDLRDKQANTERSIPMDWNEYNKLIMAKSKEELLVCIERDFGSMQQIEGISPGLLQDVAMEWIIRFKMQLEEIRHVDEPELYKNNFDKIRTTSSLEELIDIMKEVAEITVDSLARDVKSPVVQQVLRYIKESYNEDLSLKTLGAMYNIHPVYLGQLFHKEVNETFTDYINWYRIEKAKELLKLTQMKVHEIARSVGYWETGYFYKQFKRYVGISPTEYKGLS
ncbi:response regulator [Paenibacillus sp. FA6]|uniref:response regulator n=1 Tax=Paenibacillus sp. FA6 TaxID=3413029 RepID=UPI003F65B622